MNIKPLTLLASTVLSLFGIFLINTGKTSLKRTSEVAGREEVINYTLPPDFSFSIWGVIYLGFLLYAFYSLRRSQHHEPSFQRTAPKR